MMVMMLMMVSPSARQFTRRQLNRHAPDRGRGRKDQERDREEREEESEEVAPKLDGAALAYWLRGVSLSGNQRTE